MNLLHKKGFTMRRLGFLAVALAVLLCGCGAAEETVSKTTDATAAATTAVDTAVQTVIQGGTTAEPVTTATAAATNSAVGSVTAMPTTTEKTTQATKTTKHVATTTQKPTTTKPTTITQAPTPEAPVYEWQSHPQDFKLIAFGFDDLSCSSVNTTLIINTLAKYEGFGTCFVLGENLKNSGTALLEYAVQYGFEIGNHSYDHPNMKDYSYQDCLKQLRETNALLKQQMGITPKWFRPPYLATSTTLFSACFAADRMVVISGNRNSQTNTWYTVENDEATAQSAIDNAYDGAIYVMHPARTTTATAMEDICKALYNRGYRFCTISQLFEYKGVAPEYTKSYTDVYD